MDATTQASGGQSPWQGDQAPCVYCGQVIPRSEERCPQCKTSFSLAVRRASREVMGDWFYLDSRNPSGRGVTFETLIKMIEKGRIRPDSVVRGPTTHQDWLYAAEAPRLAKYLGMCPHCFAEAKPEDTYCTRCQLNMNTLPAEPRPGVPPDLVKEPVHRAAHEMEKQLAQATTAAPAPTAAVSMPPAFAPRPEAVVSVAPSETPKPGPAMRGEVAAAAAAAVAEAPAAATERRSRVAAARRGKPQLWLILVLTWIPLLLAAVVVWFVAPGLRDSIRGAFGVGPGADGGGTAKTGDEWVNRQLADARAAADARDYARAIQIYDAIIDKTGDKVTWEPRKQALLAQKAQEERKEHLAKLKERLEMAESMAADQKFDDALAVLRNIGQDDRTWLASLGVAVDKMERTIREDQVRAARARQQEEKLLADLGRAAAAKTAAQLADALKLYKQIAGTYPAEIVQKHLNVDQVIRDLETQLAAAKPPAPTPPTPPTPPPSAGMTPEQAAAAVADILGQAAAREKAEDFKEVIRLLESIKEKFEQKYWPDTLETRIRQVKAKKEALEFFGMEGPKKPPPKAGP
ncbi:MAG: hypothetical protein FJ288_15710 [Planctomycetes bacterium]|nr:hypothetical protein [Planctomycetota bacterium]